MNHLREIVIQVIKKIKKVSKSIFALSIRTPSRPKTMNQNRIDETRMNKFMMKSSEFNALLAKLPKMFDHYKVKYELDGARIVINFVPEDIHARAAHAGNTVIEAWANNNAIEDMHESLSESFRK